MILWLAGPDARSLREGLAAIATELEGVKLATQRIATALESQRAREVSAVAWHVDTPQEEV